MMHFSTVALPLLTLLTSVLAAREPTEIRFSYLYGRPMASINDVACSDGENGLIAKDPSIKHLKDIWPFPRLAGAPTIGAWNSPECGKCYKLYYEDKSIVVMAVDIGGEGFVVSREVMDYFTNYNGGTVGLVKGEFEEVECQ